MSYEDMVIKAIEIMVDMTFRKNWQKTFQIHASRQSSWQAITAFLLGNFFWKVILIITIAWMAMNPTIKLEKNSMSFHLVAVSLFYL